VDITQLTESKRRVITLLRKWGPQTKASLAEYGRMGWATVVKVINQLTDDGLVLQTGTTDDTPRSQASLYGLRADRPLAVGIDVEYKTTRVVLTNLAGDVRAESMHRTPSNSEPAATFRFFEDVIARFCEDHRIDSADLAGVGIGIPGIGFPTSSRKQNESEARTLEEELTARFETLVRIGTNTHSYAAFEKWSNETFASSDFVFVSIRTGVGTGIFQNGQLYVGVNGLAGEVGHMKVGHDARCRCGAVGCLEAVINQRHLAARSRREVLGDPEWCPEDDPRCLHAGLADLFSRAARGDSAAREIVDTFARYLGIGIAHTIIVLDITNILISGHFGPDGDTVIPTLREVVSGELLPDIEFDLRYMPLDPIGHTMGAALLVFRDFFVDIPPQ
jgi:predicted NBD/HSP70 family sugar kinase